MATKQLNKIFLSASIPYLGKEKDADYYKTADIIAIRDAGSSIGNGYNS